MEWVRRLTPFKMSQVRKDLALSAASYNNGTENEGGIGANNRQTQLIDRK